MSIELITTSFHEKRKNYSFAVFFNDTDFFDNRKQIKKNNKELLEFKKNLLKIRNSFFVKTCGEQFITEFCLTEKKCEN